MRDDQSPMAALAKARPPALEPAELTGSDRQAADLDPQSDSLLAIEQVMVTTSAEARLAGLQPGMVVVYTTIGSVGWSDEQIAVPAGSSGLQD